ncbi:protein Jade-1-like isoform X2 [Salvelinus fontinalis]|nr:protein Jade-1-like isoform X2 [Salvelinus fontinalis]XP_055718396.1 protein Jade-1-like isoform X2 [Salvelinus fontinalis]
MKRSRHPSSSEEDSDNGSNSTSWSQHSQPRRANWKKPSEVFRTDFITAMKLHDTYHLNPEDYYVLADPWRQEWEKGVQVPVSPHTIPQPVARGVAERGMEVMFTTPKKWIRSGCSGALGYVDIQTLAEGTCRYDLNDTDVAWLELINHQFTLMGMVLLDEMTMERGMEEFERRCYDRMSHAMATEEGLGMEYDEDVVCDVCRSPDSEDNNEMVFCDKCNICVHQACYGILKVPKGSWLCRTCDLGILPKCQLCPKKGGAMKPTRSGTKWVHVSCALWIPEVSIGNPEKMEPITNMSHIPSNRWALTCCLCKDQTGACIQCSAKSCRTAFHVSCALQSLEMNTILTEQDEVKFKSFCPKHSGLKGGQDGEGEEGARDNKWRKSDRVRGDEVPPPKEESRVNQQAVNLRQIKLQQLEEEFYQFVDVKEVANHLQLPPETVDFLYQYWKLKRRANHSQPLLTPQKEEEESLARREHDILLHRLQLFTHLRQDLERVRNLSYMVTRREKIKRTLWRIQEQIFSHQAALLDHEIINGCLNHSVRLSVVSAPVAVLGYSGLKTQRRDRGRGGHRRGGLHLLHNLTEGGRHIRGQTDNHTRGQTDNHTRGQTGNNSSKLKTESRESGRPRIEDRRSLRKEAPESEQQQKSRRGEDQITERRKRRRGETDQGMDEKTGEEDHGTEGRRGLKESSPIKAKTRLGSKASRLSDMTDAKPANRMSEARVRLTRVKVHNVTEARVRLTRVRVSDHVTEARVRLTRVRVSDHVTEVKERKVRLSGTDSQSDPRDTTVSMTTKHNSWLASGPGGSHLKNWGKFRIPKRSERPKEEPSNPNPPQDRLPNPPQRRPPNPPQHRPPNPPQDRLPNPPQHRPPNPPQHRPPNPPQRRPPNPPQHRLPNPPQHRPPNPPQRRPPNPPQRRPQHREPSYPRRRLRTESDGYSSANSETPPSGLDMKACHAHQLRGGAYGSDIIHQGVLAS